MFRDLLTASIALIAIAQATAPSSPLQPSGNNTSANVPAATPSDPAAVTFATDVGLMLHAVKPGAVADYENAIIALQEAFSSSTDAEARKIAASWRVLKAIDPDAKANVLYVHLLQPTVGGVDYRPSLWWDKLVAGAPPELLAKYRDAFASPPTKLSLTEFAAMSVAPVVKPTNATPGNATAPKPPPR